MLILPRLQLIKWRDRKDPDANVTDTRLTLKTVARYSCVMRSSRDLDRSLVIKSQQARRCSNK
jgi:hypothetical protein